MRNLQNDEEHTCPFDSVGRHRDVGALCFRMDVT